MTERDTVQSMAPPAGSAAALAPWSTAHRLWFRIGFCYVLLFVAPWPIDRLLARFDTVNADGYARLVHTVVAWTATHVFHSSVVVRFRRFPNNYGDGVYDFVWLAVITALTAIAVGVWSVLDRRRLQYVTLSAFLKTYLRYYLAWVMMIYGSAKLVPNGQFFFPRLDFLLTPVGDLASGDVLWTMMGISYPYTLFGGLGEVVGGALLLTRRTAPIGALMLCGVLANVFMLNASYQIGVKLASAHYWVFAAVLAAPAIVAIFQLFLRRQHVTPLVEHGPLLGQRPLLRGILKTLMVGWLGWTGATMAWRTPRQWGDVASTPLFGIWEVSEMQRAGRSLAPTLTEPTRWRQVIFERNQTFVVRRMDDSTRTLSVRVDTVARVMTLRARGDTAAIATLAYEADSAGALHVAGRFRADSLVLTLRRNPVMFRLETCKQRLIQERYC